MVKINQNGVDVKLMLHVVEVKCEDLEKLVEIINDFINDI